MARPAPAQPIADNIKILVCIPVLAGRNRLLYQKMIAAVNGILQANPPCSLYIDQRTVQGVEKLRPWSLVAVIRNMMLDSINLDHWTHLLWIDSDIIEMPPSLPADLLAVNREGITAPFVGVEDHGPDHFYDWAAFIRKGTSHIQPDNRSRISGRNIEPDAPEAEDEWDCVGCVTLVNTDVYKAGAHYADHPAFTDHFPVCLKCREMGRKVMMARNVRVTHANLPRYGEAWH